MKPEGRKPAERAWKDFSPFRFRMLLGYTLYHRGADGKENELNMACCFMLLSLGDSVIFKLLLSQNVWSDHVQTFDLERRSQYAYFK